jgi:hypothetical protein
VFIDVPWIYPTPYAYVDKIIDGTVDIGNMRAFVVAPFQPSTGAPTNLTVNVWVTPLNIDVQHLLPSDTYSEDVYIPHSGKYSVDLIKDYPEYVHSEVSLPTVLERLSINVPNDHMWFSASYDEMDLNKIMRCYSLIQTGIVTSTTVGNIIANVATPYAAWFGGINIGPLCELYGVSTDNQPSDGYKLSNMLYNSLRFLHWNGSIKFRVTFYITAFDALRVAAVINYGKISDPSTTTIGHLSANAQVFDVNESCTTFEVTVPYVSTAPWCRVYNGDNLGTNYTKYFTGILVLWIINPLTSFGATNTSGITYTIEMAGGDDYNVRLFGSNNMTFDYGTTLANDSLGGIKPHSLSTPVAVQAADGAAVIEAINPIKTKNDMKIQKIDYLTLLRKYYFVRSVNNKLQLNPATQNGWHVTRIPITNLVFNTSWQYLAANYDAYRGSIRLTVSLPSGSTLPVAIAFQNESDSGASYDTTYYPDTARSFVVCTPNRSVELEIPYISPANYQTRTYRPQQNATENGCIMIWGFTTEPFASTTNVIVPYIMHIAACDDFRFGVRVPRNVAKLGPTTYPSDNWAPQSGPVPALNVSRMRIGYNTLAFNTNPVYGIGPSGQVYDAGTNYTVLNVWLYDNKYDGLNPIAINSVSNAAYYVVDVPSSFATASAVGVSGPSAVAGIMTSLGHVVADVGDGVELRTTTINNICPLVVWLGKINSGPKNFDYTYDADLQSLWCVTNTPTYYFNAPAVPTYSVNPSYFRVANADFTEMPAPTSNMQGVGKCGYLYVSNANPALTYPARREAPSNITSKTYSFGISGDFILYDALFYGREGKASDSKYYKFIPFIGSYDECMAQVTGNLTGTWSIPPIRSDPEEWRDNSPKKGTVEKNPGPTVATMMLATAGTVGVLGVAAIMFRVVSVNREIWKSQESFRYKTYYEEPAVVMGKEKDVEYRQNVRMFKVPGYNHFKATALAIDEETVVFPRHYIIDNKTKDVAANDRVYHMEDLDGNKQDIVINWDKESVTNNDEDIIVVKVPKKLPAKDINDQIPEVRNKVRKGSLAIHNKIRFMNVGSEYKQDFLNYVGDVFDVDVRGALPVNTGISSGPFSQINCDEDYLMKVDSYPGDCGSVLRADGYYVGMLHIGLPFPYPYMTAFPLSHDRLNKYHGGAIEVTRVTPGPKGFLWKPIS